jgi:LPS O-antigen subunit length determinant protein (WzzB/FepE family)
LLKKEKILILGLCLFFSISAFFYQYSKVNKNEQIITIHINDPKLLVAQVLYFESFLDEKILHESLTKSLIRKDFLSENFKNNFLSRDNFVNFINQNKNSTELRMWFKENKIDIKYYLNENKFKFINDKKFYIALPSGLDKLSIIIDEYAFFVKDLSIEEIRKTLKLKILSELKRNEQALVYAKKISLLNPLMLNPLIQSDKDNVKIVSEPKEIFYLGEKILIEKINNLNKLVTEVSSYDFNYNPILIHASIQNVTADRVFMSTMAGLLFGLFLSISIVYLKNFKNN